LLASQVEPPAGSFVTPSPHVLSTLGQRRLRTDREADGDGAVNPDEREWI
jgi:hypothetical protein